MADSAARKADHAKGLGGVSSLESARTQVERIQDNVGQIAARSGVGGDEGQALLKLFRSWNAEAQKVVIQISKMVDALQENVTSANRLAKENQDLTEVLNSKTSQGVFEALR
jgi:thymidylate synthase